MFFSLFHFQKSSCGPDWTPQLTCFGPRAICLKPLLCIVVTERHIFRFVIGIGYGRRPCHVSPSSAYLLVKVFPIVLCHQSKQWKEGPTKWVETGVAIVWITSYPSACETLRTLPASKKKSVKCWRKSDICMITWSQCKLWYRYRYRQKYILCWSQTGK